MPNILSYNGLKGLSSNDRKTWEQDYSAILQGRTEEEQDRLFRNQQFKAAFGDREDYDSLKQLSPEQRDQYLENAFFKQQYGDSAEYDTLKQLTPNARRYLLDNDYQTQEVIDEAYKQQLEIQNRQKFNLGPMFGGQTSATAGFNRKGAENNAKDILDKARQINFDDIKTSVADDTAVYADAMIQEAYKNPEYAEQINKEFNDLADDISPYWKAYKDNYQLENYSLSDKAKALAQFQAIMERGGGQDEKAISDAVEIFDNDMHHTVYKNTDTINFSLDNRIFNTAKQAYTKLVANTAQSVLGVVALGAAAAQGIANVAGVDTGDESWVQNMLDSDLESKVKNGETDLSFLYNLRYWNNVDMYNTFDAAEMSKIQQNGGISTYNNVRDVGHEYDLLSLETIPEAAVMIGYMLSGRYLDKAAVSLLGRYANTAAGTVARAGLSAAGISTGYGVGAYDTTYEEAMQKFDALMESDAGKQAVKARMDISGISENDAKIALRREAEEEAKKSATAAYMTDATIEGLRNGIMNALFKQYLFSKPLATRSKGIADRLAYKAAETGKTSDIWAARGARMGQNMWAGFISNFNDDVTTGVAKGVGLHDFEDYLTDTYEGTQYSDVSGLFGDIFAGIAGGYNALWDDATWHDGWIGGLGSVFSVAPTSKTFSRNVGTKDMTFAQKFSERVFNPLLSDVALTDAEISRYSDIQESVINTFNKHPEDYKTIATAANAISKMNLGRADGDGLKARDEKDKAAFRFISELGDIQEANGLNQEVTAYMEQLRQAAKGNISDEFVQEFLAAPENNNTVSELGGVGAARAVAREYIQDNARKLYDSINTYNEIRQTIDNAYDGILTPDSRKELTYQNFMMGRWAERQNDMNKSLGATTNNTRRSLAYTQIAHDDIQREIDNLDNKYKEEIKKLEDEVQKHSPKEGQEQTEEAKVLYNNALLDLNKVRASYEVFKVESEREKLNYENARVLTADEIINAEARQRQELLSNPERFTPEQQLEINKAKEKLTQKLPNYMNEVNDAAVLQTRLERASMTYRILTENPMLLSAYETYKKDRATQHLITRVNTQYWDKSAGDILASENRNTAILRYSKDTLEEVKKRHPELASDIEKMLPIVELNEHAKHYIDDTETDAKANALKKNSIYTIISRATSVEEAMNAIEDAIDSEGVSQQDREFLKDVARNLAQIGYQRDATRVADRAARETDETIRKRREEAEKKAYEEMRKKAEVAKPVEQQAVVEEKKPTEAPAEGEITGTPEALSKDEVAEMFGIEEGKTKVEKETQEVEQGEKKEEKKEEGVSEESTPEQQEGKVIVDDNGNWMVESTQGSGNVKSVSSSENPPTPEPRPVQQTSGISVNGNQMQNYTVRDHVQIAKDLSKQPISTEFFNWLANEGINLDNIINDELPDIIALDPDIDIHFVRYTPLGDNISIDKAVQKTVFLAVEVNDKVRRIHKEANGGIIIGQDGKQYLIIGDAGYTSYQDNPNVAAKEYFQNLNDVIKTDSVKYNNEAESQGKSKSRIFVHPTLVTKFDRYTNEGQTIKRLVGQETSPDRDLSELLRDSNPKDYDLIDLKWGFYVGSDFKTVGLSDRDSWYKPTSTTTQGQLYLMLPLASGKYAPVAMKFVHIGDIADGRLKSDINNLLGRVTSGTLEERKTALRELSGKIVMTADGDKIYFAPDGSIVVNKQGIEVFKGNPESQDFDRKGFIEAVNDVNFLINVTQKTLTNRTALQDYLDAGALKTDIATLGIKGTAYTIRTIDMATGKPAVVNPVQNIQKAQDNSDYQKAQPKIVVNNGNEYHKNDDGHWVDNNGELVNEKTASILALKENIEKGTKPDIERDGKQWYIVGDKAFIKVGDNISILTPSAAKQLIDRLAQERAEAEILANAQKASKEDIDKMLHEESQSTTFDNSGKMFTFEELLFGEETGEQLSIFLEEYTTQDGSKLPTDANKLKELFIEKGVPVIGITDVDSLINTIKCKIS